MFGRNELDDSFKDKRFGDNIKVEFIFEKSSDKLNRKAEAKLGINTHMYNTCICVGASQLIN